MIKLLVLMVTLLFFFKQVWSVVGRDFYVVVQDFFLFGKLLKKVNHLLLLWFLNWLMSHQ